MDKEENLQIELILLKRCTGDELSEEELLQLSIWLQDSQKHITYYEKIQEFPYKETAEIPVQTEVALERFLENIKNYNSSKSDPIPEIVSSNLDSTKFLKKKRFPIWQIAAAFVGVLLTMGGLAYMSLNLRDQAVVPKVKTVQLIAEGGLFLNLEDPKTIANNPAAKHIRIAANSLIYQETEKAVKPELHTLITPENKHYTIVLPDSTKVYLNGSSELKYSVPFVGTQRNVFLQGEAYFEVAKGHKPFIVHADQVQVKAYGTEFNVNTYGSGLVKALLVEGSIGIKAGDNAHETMLKPQELAILNRSTGQCVVKEVASAGYLAWKTGYFSFKTVRLDEIMESVANHYGIAQVQYERESLRSQKLSAYITTERGLNEVLELFEATTGLKIKNKTGIIYISE